MSHKKRGPPPTSCPILFFHSSYQSIIKHLWVCWIKAHCHACFLSHCTLYNRHKVGPLCMCCMKHCMHSWVNDTMPLVFRLYPDSIKSLGSWVRVWSPQLSYQGKSRDDEVEPLNLGSREGKVHRAQSHVQFWSFNNSNSKTTTAVVILSLIWTTHFTPNNNSYRACLWYVKYYYMLTGLFIWSSQHLCGLDITAPFYSKENWGSRRLRKGPVTAHKGQTQNHSQIKVTLTPEPMSFPHTCANPVS